MSGPDLPIVRSEGGFSIWDTVLSQYANSPILTKLLQNVFDYLDPSANFDDFYQYVWDVDTAQGFGLDIWGRIVGVERAMPVVKEDMYWGFDEAYGDDGTIGTFGEAPFYRGERLTEVVKLSDDAYRTLILAKAAFNITDGSIKSINSILRTLFDGRGNCYVTDYNTNYKSNAEESDADPMTMKYVFRFELTNVEYAIINYAGVLPKPAGVEYDVVISEIEGFYTSDGRQFILSDGAVLYVQE